MYKRMNRIDHLNLSGSCGIQWDIFSENDQQGEWHRQFSFVLVAFPDSDK